MNKAEQSIIQGQYKRDKIVGTNPSHFTMVFKEDWWKPENLTIQEMYNVKVTKVYKFTWWKRILFKLGFPFVHFECTLI